jgi:hypothetical protein
MTVPFGDLNVESIFFQSIVGIVVDRGTHSSGFFIKKKPPFTALKKAYVYSDNALRSEGHAGTIKSGSLPK